MTEQDILESEEEKREAISKFIRYLFLISCIILVISNLLYYLFLYTMPIDILGITILIIALLQLYFQLKQRIAFLAVCVLICWVITTFTWRIIIFENREILEANLIGYPLVVIIFGTSAFLFLCGMFLLLQIVGNSHEFSVFLFSHPKAAVTYIRAFLLYLLLHITFSFAIIIPVVNSSLLVFLDIGLFVKLFVVPGLGVLCFGITGYIFSLKTEEVKK